MRLGSVPLPLIRVWISESLSKVGRGTLTEPRFSPLQGREISSAAHQPRRVGLSVGAAESVPVFLLLPNVGRSLVPARSCRQLSAAAPRPRPLPVRAGRLRSTASQGRAGGGQRRGGALALALTAVLDWGARTGGAQP
jgi:hypothetical protein